MYKTAIVSIAMLFTITCYAGRKVDTGVRDVLEIKNNNSCIKISEQSFFRLGKGNVTISHLKENPKLVTVSYLPAADYRPMANRIDLLTIREQSSEVAEKFFQKASLGMQSAAEKVLENKVVQTSEKNISCGTTGKAPGLADAEMVMCYLRTDRGTHTFSMPIKGEIAQETANVYSKFFTDKPCSNVIALDSPLKRIPASKK